MRTTTVIALLGAAVALFTGCSASSSTPAISSAGASAPFLPSGPIDARRLVELQAAGILYSPLTHDKLTRMLAAVEQGNGAPRFAGVRGDVKQVRLWTTLTSRGYLLGQGKVLKDTVASVNTVKNGCVYPTTVKVDPSQNVWVGCEYNTNDDDGVYQEYSSSGTLSATYTDGCPAPVSECGSFYSYSDDGAANSSYVFDALAYYDAGLNCNPSCQYSYGGGFEYWPVGGSKSAPTLIALPYGEPVYGVAFMDLDSSGNIWFDYFGCTVTICGNGIAELTSPTSNPTFVSIEPPGFLQCNGGVYTSAKSTVVNVTDQCSATTYQFATSGSETGTLGPIPYPAQPVSGGFNAKDSKFALGDYSAWIDVDAPATNKWKAEKGVFFSGALMGAAYTPSDK